MTRLDLVLDAVRDILEDDRQVCLPHAAGQNVRIDAVALAHRGDMKTAMCRECLYREIENGNVDATEPVKQPTHVLRLRKALEETLA